MSDLAAQATMSASGLTRVVDRLTEAVLVERVACPDDRRGSYAVLTDEGRRRIEQALPLQVGHLDELVGAVLEPGELESLTAVLRKLRDAVNPSAAQASTCPTG